MSRIGDKPPLKPVAPIARIRRPPPAGKDPGDEGRLPRRRPDPKPSRGGPSERVDGGIDEMA